MSHQPPPTFTTKAAARKPFEPATSPAPSAFLMAARESLAGGGGPGAARWSGLDRARGRAPLSKSEETTTFTRRAALAAAGALAGCAPQGRASAAVRIGYQRDGVLLLAQSDPTFAGRLKRLGVRSVEWVLFPSGPPLLEAMRAGAVDFGSTGETPPIFAQAGGARLVYAAAEPVTGRSQALLVPRGSKASRLEELRGRSVALTPGSSSHLFALNALRKSGLTLADIKVVPLSPPEAAAAFARGSLDGWIIWDSYFARAQKDSGARVLMDGQGLPPTSSFYLASRDFAERSPERLRAVLDGLRGAAAQGEADPERAIAVIARASGLPADIVRTSRRRGPFAVTPMSAEQAARQQANADLFSDAHVIPTRLRVSDAVWTGWTA